MIMVEQRLYLYMRVSGSATESRFTISMQFSVGNKHSIQCNPYSIRRDGADGRNPHWCPYHTFARFGGNICDISMCEKEMIHFSSAFVESNTQYDDRPLLIMPPLRLKRVHRCRQRAPPQNLPLQKTFRNPGSAQVLLPGLASGPPREQPFWPLLHGTYIVAKGPAEALLSWVSNTLSNFTTRQNK